MSSSNLRDQHVNLFGAYQELVRRQLSTYALVHGYFNKEVPEAELRDAINEICANLKVACRLSEDMHIHFKDEILKGVFGAQKQYWVKK